MKKLPVAMLGLILIAASYGLIGCEKPQQDEHEKAKELVQQAHKQIKEVDNALEVLDKNKKPTKEEQE